MSFTSEKRQTIDEIFKTKGYNDYKWIDPKKIIVSQWVRMKCQFGCGEYGHGAACPPNTRR
jgi:predicted metal-binding protein